MDRNSCSIGPANSRRPLVGVIVSILLEKLEFEYPDAGGELVFRDLNLTIAQSSIHAIMAFSGVGKTTLLKLIGGLLRPTNGRLSLTSERSGYVPQEPSLLPWLTVARNLSLGGELLGEADVDVQANWRSELASKFALDRFLDRRPRALSGGMMQRAAVISAITSGADTLLLDEPFAGSDRLRKKAMFDALGEFRRRTPNGIVLFTTHDPGDVFGTGANAIWLDSVTRQATMISPADGEWDKAQREKLLDLMTRETV